MKKSLKDDNEFKVKLREIANERANDPTTHDLEVYKDQAIKKLCEKEKVKACRGCGSINCHLWMIQALKDKNPR